MTEPLFVVDKAAACLNMNLSDALSLVLENSLNSCSLSQLGKNEDLKCNLIPKLVIKETSQCACSIPGSTLRTWALPTLTVNSFFVALPN